MGDSGPGSQHEEAVTRSYRARPGPLGLLTSTDSKHCSPWWAGLSPRVPGTGILLTSGHGCPGPRSSVLTAALAEAFSGYRTEVPKSLMARAAAGRPGSPRSHMTPFIVAELAALTNSAVSVTTVTGRRFCCLPSCS